MSHTPDLAIPRPAHDRPARPATDLGNAERLADAYGHEVRFVPEWRSWLIWDGRRWTNDRGGRVHHYAKETIRSIESAEDAQLASWALRSESQKSLSAMVKLAGTDPGLVVDAGSFDAQDHLLNCVNGTVDLRTGQLREHSREDLLTKMTGASYNPSAACPTWRAFLARIFHNDSELIEYIQRLAGYSATASLLEHVLIVAYGGGRNGKSTLLETIRAALGEYTQALPATTLMESRDGHAGGPNNDIARLRGVRFASAVETGEGCRLAEARVKSLTGGDTQTARFLHQEFFEFTPSAKIWLATNHRPQIKGGDHGIWSRLRLIPFTATISDAEMDKTLPDKLRAELPGILAWIVEGSVKWHQNGLTTPQAVVEATNEYQTEQDTIGQFLDDETRADPQASIGAGMLYERYRAWATAQGEYVKSQKAFGMALTDRGYERKKLGVERRWHWVGIAGPTIATGAISPF